MLAAEEKVVQNALSSASRNATTNSSFLWYDEVVDGLQFARELEIYVGEGEHFYNA